jgi:hypothetical protein
MPSRVVVLLALGCLALVDAPLRAQPQGGPPAAQYGWLFDLEEGKALARKGTKPLLIVFRCEP